MTTGSLRCRRLSSARPFVPIFLVLVKLLGIGPLSTGKGIAYVDGPPPESTGGFGEETCHKCHFENDLNDAAGSLGLEGIPESYAPGQHYLIEIVLERPGIGRGGFEQVLLARSGKCFSA